MSGTHRSGIALVLAAALPMLAGSSTPAGAEITHTQAIDELAKAADTEGQLNIVWGSDSWVGARAPRRFRRRSTASFTPM